MEGRRGEAGLLLEHDDDVGPAELEEGEGVAFLHEESEGGLIEVPFGADERNHRVNLGHANGEDYVCCIPCQRMPPDRIA